MSYSGGLGSPPSPETIVATKEEESFYVPASPSPPCGRIGTKPQTSSNHICQERPHVQPLTIPEATVISSPDRREGRRLSPSLSSLNVREGGQKAGQGETEFYHSIPSRHPPSYERKYERERRESTKNKKKRIGPNAVTLYRNPGTTPTTNPLTRKLPAGYRYTLNPRNERERPLPVFRYARKKHASQPIACRGGHTHVVAADELGWLVGVGWSLVVLEEEKKDEKRAHATIVPTVGELNKAPLPLAGSPKFAQPSWLLSVAMRTMNEPGALEMMGNHVPWLVGCG